MTNTCSVALQGTHWRREPAAEVIRFHRARTDSYEAVVDSQTRHPVLSVLLLLAAGPAMVLAVAAAAAAVVTPVAWLCGWL